MSIILFFLSSKFILMNYFALLSPFNHFFDYYILCVIYISGFFHLNAFFDLEVR
ncbi:hypothetical protein H8356DRAFT_1670301 [Neocallimastix lanati (nom. inval.)]|nr:hypothetical protein H8356DRAFT_1670301 [Neocallimastix sp. JGI-2020a]